MVKKLSVTVLLGVALVTLAGPLRTLPSNGPVRASDVDHNFKHIDSTMVGGHGARLSPFDVDAGAAIEFSKLYESDGFPSLIFTVDGADGGHVCGVSAPGTTPCDVDIITHKFSAAPTITVTANNGPSDDPFNYIVTIDAGYYNAATKVILAQPQEQQLVSGGPFGVYRACGVAQPKPGTGETFRVRCVSDSIVDGGVCADGGTCLRNDVYITGVNFSVIMWYDMRSGVK